MKKKTANLPSPGEPLDSFLPEERVLTEGTRDLLTIVLSRGSEEDRVRLRPLDHYTFSLDLEEMRAEGSRYEHAHDELRALVMEISGRS